MLPRPNRFQAFLVYELDEASENPERWISFMSASIFHHQSLSLSALLKEVMRAQLPFRVITQTGSGLC